MALGKRLARLEAHRGTGIGADAPRVILLCDGGGEAQIALSAGHRALSRDKDEDEAQFIARAENTLLA